MTPNAAGNGKLIDAKCMLCFADVRLTKPGELAVCFACQDARGLPRNGEGLIDYLSAHPALGAIRLVRDGKGNAEVRVVVNGQWRTAIKARSGDVLTQHADVDGKKPFSWPVSSK